MALKIPTTDTFISRNLVLPERVVKEIYHFLPIEDRVISFPKVCRVWRAISVEMNEFHKFVRVSMPLFEWRDNSEEQNQRIVDLARKNNVLSMISNLKCSQVGRKHAELHSVDTYSCMYGLEDVSLRSTHYSFSRRSDKFNISWNPRTLKLSNGVGTCGDYRANFVVEARIVNLYATARNNLLANYCELQVFQEAVFERKKIFTWKNGFCSWNEVCEMSIKPAKMYRAIATAFELNLKIKAVFLAHLNLSFLEAMPVDIMSNLDITGIAFKCNQYGKILSVSHVDRDSALVLKISNEHVSSSSGQSKRMPILTWYPRDCFGRSLGSQGNRVIDLFRGTVISRTVAIFAERLGIAIIED